jgi:hypothetical protein
MSDKKIKELEAEIKKLKTKVSKRNSERTVCAPLCATRISRIERIARIRHQIILKNQGKLVAEEGLEPPTRGL